MTDWRDAPYWRHIETKTRKAVNGGAAAIAWQNDYPLRSLSNDPCERAAAYLKAYKVGWFYKAESKISGDIADLDVSVAHEDDSGQNETMVIEPDLFTPWEQLDPIGQFLRLMERPNPTQTGRQLRQKTQIRNDMAGWSYWYMEGAGPVGSGQLPTALYGISPTRLTPSFDKTGQLIGWVLDANERGGGTPFPAYEILPFVNASADDSWYGVGVVEAVWPEVPLSGQIAQHTSDLLSTGGRLAGMLWPKERTLDESEFLDAQRAWRNVSSDANAAKRLLLFPEPMEYAAGASTPAEIGIPDLANLNRDNILTAFPISPYQLGVPMPGGLNSAQQRVEDRRDYWEGTIGPRVDLLEETIQVGMLSLYEAVLNTTYDFDISIPNLDDAASLAAKADAMDKLIVLGFTAKSAIDALGLDALEWVEPPPPVVPAPLTPPDQVPMDQTPPMPQMPAKAYKSSAETARDSVTDPATVRAKARLEAFFQEQKARVVDNLRTSLPASKADRMKADPTWWDAQEEDDELAKVLRDLYAGVGRGALQNVADTVGKFVFKGAVNNVIADLLTVGGQRIKGINEVTLEKITIELAEGTRRGYSITQLIDGVPDEGFRGIANLTQFDDARAEMIARTETMLSYNRATLDGYKEFQVQYVEAYDGDQDQECADRVANNPWPIEEALAQDDHPNGTLVWSPIVDKAYHEPDPTILALIETVKALIDRPQPNVPNIYLNSPEVKASDVFITNTPPMVTVEPAQVTVEGSNVQVDVHVPETLPPIVNVEPQQVDVHLPDSPTPVVQVDVHIPEAKAKTKTVNRDAKGQIVSITDGE